MKNQTSQRFSDEWRTEATTRRGEEEGGALSLCRGNARFGRRAAALLGHRRPGGGNDKTYPFCYCVEEGERDGGIILMA